MDQRTKLSFLLLLVSALVWITVGLAAGQGTLPHTFYGTVYLNGSPVPPDTQITARIDETVCSTTRTDANSQYVLDVPSAGEKPGCGVDEVTIHFFIDEVEADQTAAFESGSLTQLDLSATVEEPSPTPTSSVAPTETPTALPTATVTPTSTTTPTMTATPSATLTKTATAQVTPTSPLTPPWTPTHTATATATAVHPTPTETVTPEEQRLYLPLIGRSAVARGPAREHTPVVLCKAERNLGCIP